MHKYFSINDAGFSIRCKLYCSDPRNQSSLVIFSHGFGGHKDNHAAELFADRLLSKKKDWGVLTFDWPCHGEDARRKFTLGDCLAYFDTVIRYCRTQMGIRDLYLYATSFGAFLALVYLDRNEDPFRGIAFRCPAIPMHESMDRALLTDENRAALAKGKETLVGFDRKVRIGPSFLEEIRGADVSGNDYRSLSDHTLILHGTKDEIVPIGPAEAFADRNDILFLPIENADHRFMNPQHMDEAIHEIILFFTE